MGISFPRGFVVVCYLVFFAMRLLYTPRISYLAKTIDVLFLGSLTLLVVAGFLTVYTFIWDARSITEC